jgi:hypothetical protein
MSYKRTQPGRTGKCAKQSQFRGMVHSIVAQGNTSSNPSGQEIAVSNFIGGTYCPTMGVKPGMVHSIVAQGNTSSNPSGQEIAVSNFIGGAYESTRCPLLSESVALF